jgi:glutathione S-transferase
VITLFGPRAAPVVNKVAKGLGLKGLEFTQREPGTTEDYWRWSPETGRLPVIDIDGERIHDSTAILLRIDELHPDPPFFSSDPRIGSAQRRMVTWADESYVWYWMRWQQIRPEGPPVGPPVSGAVFGGGPGVVRPDEPTRPAGMSLRNWVATRLQKRTTQGESEHARLIYEIGHRVDDMARLLAGRPFFYSEQISMADLSVYAVLQSLLGDSIPGGRNHVEQNPQLLDHARRVEQETGG